ncbi:MAG TPA: hypothetical protein VGI76_00475 [Solirubrobacteraceae bacterium]
MLDAGEGGAIDKLDGAGKAAEFTGLKGDAITGVGVGGTLENQLAVDNSSSADKGDIYLANASHVGIYAPDGTQLGELNGEVEGPWGKPCGVAVDSSGDVYVGLWPEHVNKYKAPAKGPISNTDYVASLGGLPEICNVAVDAAGTVDTNTYPNGPVTRFAPGQFGQPQAQGSTVDATGGSLAADLVGDALYVDEANQIAAYDQTATRIDAFASLGGSVGVAVDGASNTIYVSDPAKEHAVDVFSPAVLPDVSALSPTGLKTTSATLAGTVNPDGVAITACEFSYGTLPVLLNLTAGCSSNPGAGSAPVSVSTGIEGLNPNETYYFQLAAANANGQSADTGQFTTPAAPPIVDDRGTSASSVERRNALLGGAKVNSQNSPTTCYFEFGTTTAYERTTHPTEIGPGMESVVAPVVSVVQLQPGTTYHYALVATNQAGTVTGEDHTFTTASVLAPQVGSTAIGDLAPGAATVSGSVIPDGLATTYEIDLGTDTRYGTSTSGEVLGASQAVSMTLLYLLPSTTYHYRIVATNEDGTATSGDQTFTTPAYPILLPQVLPQVTQPAIAFPAEEKTSKVKSKPKAKKKTKKRKKAKYKKKK